VFVPGKLFQPSLMFVGEARKLPWSEAPERCFTQVGSSLTRKHSTSLEKLARDKHPSLLRISVNYGQKSFITLGPDRVKHTSLLFMKKKSLFTRDPKMPQKPHK
jgi:hypothetical protein